MQFIKKMASINNRLHHGALLKHTLAFNAMNAGDGPHSYAQNSTYQRGVVEVAKPIIEEAIATKLDIKLHGSSNIGVADFGCSTGHNSFPAMQIITQSIKQKLHRLDETITPEFYVYFNDLYSNDFNTLFGSLPPPDQRHYRAAAVAGDFHRRLLPESSLHFAYSSWSLHWLTGVPKGVAERDSPACNKGEILYTTERKEVCEAYLKQYQMDIESFLKARAVEVVGGGLMAIVIAGVPDFWDPQTEYTIPSDVNLLGSCLMDMATMGRFSETKVDSFNLPYYFSTPKQLKSILERSDSFTIERMDILNNPGKHTLPTVNARAAFFRAVHERLLIDHFGSEIIDELFYLYMKKLESSPVFLNPYNDKSIMILAVLKRKADN